MPAPVPGPAVVEGYPAALEAATLGGRPLLVGGVSLGAHVAARWAAERASPPPVGAAPAPASPGGAESRRRGPSGPVIAGLLLALPAWTASPETAPAALAARATAARARAGGLRAAVDAERAGTPAWLAEELERAWRGYGAGLADALAAAAAEPAPDHLLLGRLAMPTGVVGLVDDPVHPLDVAQAWQDRMPCASLVTTGLAALGAAAVLGWLRARHSRR